jgi:lysophospholipase L1-like esterase
VVDTRGTLTRAELGHPGDSRDWQNEIHPNGGGYEKLAKKIEPVLEALLAP